MKAPKIFYATRARRELELAATAAFEDIASAIAAQNPALDRAECRRTAQFILEGTARQIREGQVVIDHRPNRLSLAFSEADDFMELVRTLIRDRDRRPLRRQPLGQQVSQTAPERPRSGLSHLNTVRPNRQTVRSIREETESDGA